MTEEEIREQLKVSRNQCGPCGMCCKVMNVPEMGKTDGQWCSKFCKGIGCTIYEQRPERCVDFYCLWRMGLTLDKSEAMRPDKSKVVFSPGTGNPPTITAFVDPSRPQAWEAPLVLAEIKRLAGSGLPVIVSNSPGRRKLMFVRIAAHGDTAIVGHKWIQMSESDENGVQWYEGDLTDVV